MRARYDHISWRIAIDYVAALSDEELVAEYTTLAREDALALWAGGRGVIDNPRWTLVLQEAERRGIDLGIPKLG